MNPIRIEQILNDGVIPAIESISVGLNNSLYQNNLVLSGTVQQFSTDTACTWVFIQAHPDNTAYTYIGNSISVSSTNYMVVLDGGEKISLPVSNINLLYVVGATSDKVSCGGGL